jgi:hypothetical protein
MTVPGDSTNASTPAPEPTTEQLASSWFVLYVRAHQPLVLRLGSWIPFLAIPLVLFTTPTIGLVALLIGLAALLIIAPLSMLNVHRHQPLLPVLRELAAFRNPTSPQHLSVLTQVLRAAFPKYLAIPKAQRPGADTFIKDEALRLFVITDAEGCGAGHSDVCRHRRDNDAWMHWIAPDEVPAPARHDMPVTTTEERP